VCVCVQYTQFIEYKHNQTWVGNTRERMATGGGEAFVVFVAETR